ncbi:zf-HC2 domain-containing protein [Paludibaculum fermentans]|uniref:zf-HC2 domain-containing protein n=1 Tax=Paludibaculum fermentans TaxID=1473598 RepID=UPI003EBDED6D
MTSLGWEDDGAQEGLMLRRSVGKCLTEAEMEDYLANRLSGVTREVIEEHLLVCAKCLDSVEQEEEFAGVFRSAAMQIEAEEMEKSLSAEAGSAPVDIPVPDEPGVGNWWSRVLRRVFGR